MLSLQDVSIKCRNFKCFSEDAKGFETIKPINVIIGRNNSGKTTLLDLIEHATRGTAIVNQGHKGRTPEVLLSWDLTEERVEKVFIDGATLKFQGTQWTFNPQEWAKVEMTGRCLTWNIAGGEYSFVKASNFTVDNPRDQMQLDNVVKQLRKSLYNPFRQYGFQRIVADRDIVPEERDPTLDIQPNGAGVTNAIQQYINAVTLDRDLIENTLLNDLNWIFGSDANYTRIAVQQEQGKGLWEIHLEEPGKGWVRMSQTGSGLKTVLLVLANLLLVPQIGDKPRSVSEFLFGFEELENNLHPAVQRRLFRYLQRKAIDEECHFFITTHSNVVIDLLSNDKHAQLLHVTHDGESAALTPVETYADGRGVLDDLGVRASDLLQTNVVVWVEGPSDRIYFNRWIDLWSDGELTEGIHYQCLPFGGSLNAHLSFDSPEWGNDMISALKINGHAILLADSDRRGEGDKLKPHVQRLAREVAKVGGYAWITAGKEVENYIPAPAFQRMFKNESLRGPGRYSDALRYIANHRENKTPPRKVELAREIVPLLLRDSIGETLDMVENLDKVYEFIRKWNRCDQPEL